MEFTNEFRVSSDVDTTFATLVDLERVAPCMPGAVLEEVDGDSYRGRMKVRVGPIRVQYRGVAELIDVVPDKRRVAIRASGQEERGSGTARADVVATLQEEQGHSVVTVNTDLNVTGKPAQFGRGVMGEVGAGIIGQFADRLERLLQQQVAGAEQDTSIADADPAVMPADDIDEARQGPEDDALDLIGVAGPATVKRLVFVGVAAAIVGFVWWLVRR